jgi:hypothetical protein
MDLSTYGLVRPWAEAIKEEVLERRMPPWGAVKGFGDFRGDASLTEEEIAIVSGWAEGGAPEGDPALLPAYPETRQEHKPERERSGALTLHMTGELKLKHAVTLAAIRPETIPEGASIRIVAENPDGIVEPIIWLYRYAPRFGRTYYFRVPLSFRAGTIFQMEPAIGSVSLLLNKN